jgi:hypothetical protein
MTVWREVVNSAHATTRTVASPGCTFHLSEGEEGVTLCGVSTDFLSPSESDWEEVLKTLRNVQVAGYSDLVWRRPSRKLRSFAEYGEWPVVS